MTYQHCNPCTNFGSCLCCEQPMCNDCKESIDSPHMHLSEKSADEIAQLETENDLWADGFCLECQFYSHHDINNSEQESYNHDMHFKIERYDVEERSPYGYTRRKSKSRVIILGEKPKPTFPIIRGPFIIIPIEKE